MWYGCMTDPTTEPMDFDAWQRELGEVGFELSASELHGILTGYLCATASLNMERLAELVAQPMTPLAQTTVLLMVRDAQKALVDDDFGFEPLLPDDQVSASTRVSCLAGWCGGFLAGFGGAGQFREADLPEIVGEALPDLMQIASIRDDMPEGDENDADLMEIEEYVRVAVMTVFVECTRGAEAGESPREPGGDVL